MAKKLNVAIRSDLVVGRSGRPKGVVLSMREFRRIASLLADVADATWMKSVASEEKQAVSWEDVKRRLRKRGLL